MFHVVVSRSGLDYKRYLCKSEFSYKKKYKFLGLLYETLKFEVLNKYFIPKVGLRLLVTIIFHLLVLIFVFFLGEILLPFLYIYFLNTFIIIPKEHTFKVQRGINGDPKNTKKTEDS